MTLIKERKAVYITKFGGAEVLQIRSRPLLPPKANEVTIKVRAAGINRPDILQRQGLYKPTKKNINWPGLEVAGEIIALGKNVKKWQIGDKIIALCNGGGYADFVNVPFGQILPLPKNWSFVEGATLAENFFTIYQTLIMRAGLKKNMDILIHGAAGGIGASAVQIANYFGANIFASISDSANKEKLNYVKSLGADYIIDYEKQDFVEQILTITEQRGVDRIIDIVGGPYLARHIKLCALNGKIIQLAFLGGAKAEINIAHILLKNLTIFGSTLASKNSTIKAKIAKGLERNIWPALNEGRIKPQKIKIFKLSEVVKAHLAFEEKQHFGRIILEIA